MIILMGLAGSGKSTQGQILAESTGREWLSVGQVLRDTGQFDDILKTGQLVDDREVVQLMAEAMAEIVRQGKDAVLDGFPRDAEQAKWIAENIVGVIKMIILIDVPKDELVKRLLLRGRADDTKEAIIERFKITEQNISAICEILGARGVPVRKIDGVGTVEEIALRVKDTVAELDGTS